MDTTTDLDQKEEELIARFIELDSRRPGLDEARVIGSGVPVWALVPHLQAGDGDVDAVAAAYGLPREAVEAAAAYYCRHRSIIDARIEANAA